MQMKNLILFVINVISFESLKQEIYQQEEDSQNNFKEKFLFNKHPDNYIQ